MLRFQLFGFPVRIEWTFWILCLILGMSFLQQPGSEALGKFVLLAAIVTGSILVHELGHAYARKQCGAPYSELILHNFGGLCTGPGQFSRGQTIWIAGAGPLASITLGCLAGLLVFTPGASENIWLKFFVAQMIWVNIGWAILNLLPIFPLDGGQIAAAAAGPQHYRTVLWVGVVLAGLIAVVVLALISRRSLFSAVLFGMLAYSNWQRLKGNSGAVF